MAVVEIFVRCAPSGLEDTLKILESKGFHVTHHSGSKPGLIIGTIEENKVPDLMGIDGVLGVWGDKQFDP